MAERLPDRAAYLGRMLDLDAECAVGLRQGRVVDERLRVADAVLRVAEPPAAQSRPRMRSSPPADLPQSFGVSGAPSVSALTAVRVEPLQTCVATAQIKDEKTCQKLRQCQQHRQPCWACLCLSL